MLSFSHGTLMLDVDILCVAGSVASVAASERSGWISQNSTARYQYVQYECSSTSNISFSSSLVGKRKVHKEKGKEAGLGFTYKKLSNGLFEVSKIKPGGFAEKSGLIQPKDVVHFVDGTPCEDVAGPMAFAELLTGPVGSSCELSLSRGASKNVFVVQCTRMVLEQDEDLMSIKSDASQSRSKVCACIGACLFAQPQRLCHMPSFCHKSYGWLYAHKVYQVSVTAATCHILQQGVSSVSHCLSCMFRILLHVSCCMSQGVSTVSHCLHLV